MILAWYSTLLVRHFSLSGHWCFLIQLHVLAILSFGGLIVFLLCVLIVFPLSIKSRLSKNSSNEKIFKESAQVYQEALKKSGYNHKLTYQKSINNKNKDTKQRRRKIIWFHPPYSKNISAKVINQFLKLINKYFP